MESSPHGLTRGQFLRLTAAGLGVAYVGPGRLLAADGTRILAAGAAPDLILVNAKVLTMDAADSTAQALAMRGGLLTAVGTEAAIRALADSSTAVRDCGGKAVTPGIVDTHLHFQLVGLLGSFYTPFVPPEVNTLAQLQAKLSSVVASVPAGQWVQGYFLLGQYLPTRHDLDPVSPNHPVFLMHQPGHIGSANSRALQIAGITSATPDPTGGIIERDGQGNPTGVLYNHRAMDLVRKNAPTYSLAQQRESILATQRTYARWGVTTYHDNNVRGADNVASYLELGRRHELWLRGAISYTLEYPQEVTQALALAPTAGPFMRLAGYKFLIDGQVPTAYCHEPHNGTSWNLTTWDRAAFKQAVKTLHETGLQICVHCVGDAATDLVLDAYEEAMNAFPRPDPRHRIEHAVLTRRESTQRMKDLGVVLSVQPTFIRFGGDGYEAVLGSERMKRIIVTREWLDAGVKMALSSDGPTMPWLSPGVTLAAALTRSTTSGRVIGADQVLTIREALRAHTATAAWAIHRENELGSLEPGKAADVIVWTKDPLTSTPAELFNATVDLSIVGGKVVYPLGATGTWLLPSSARAQGAGAFWTTDLTIANTGTADAGITLKFLGHDKDGRDGAEKSYALGAGRSVTYPDVLHAVFDQTSAWGAILIRADTNALAVTGQTWTPNPAGPGTFGQSVPGAAPMDLIVYGFPRSIVDVRQDATYRTNLMLANFNETACDVDVTLFLQDGTSLPARQYRLEPLGMTQVTTVATALGATGNVTGARLALSTPTENGAFAAYAACIDMRTGDPRTLLPR